MIDIDRTLRLLDVEAESNFVQAEAIDAINYLLRENARYKLTQAKYVEVIDRMNGTPCEQIRHQQEVEALREENSRLRAVIQFILDNQISERRSEHIDCVIIHGEPIRAAAAAILEAVKAEAACPELDEAP